MKQEFANKVLKGEAPVPRVRTITVAGRPLRMYTIGWLCIMSSASAVTLRLWERKKILPKPLFDPNDIEAGLRWYTAGEVDFYARAISDYFRSSPRKLQHLKAELTSRSIRLRHFYTTQNPVDVQKQPRSFFELQDEVRASVLLKDAASQRRRQNRTDFFKALNRHEGNQNQPNGNRA